MSMWEDRQEQSRRELEAYNRMANPNLYIQSGQMDRDRAAGRINSADVQSVADAAARRKVRQK